MSMKALLATCVALSCVALVLAAPSCRFQFSNPTATFDLSALKNPSPTGWFSEDDSDPMGEAADYYYWYNFCSDLPAPPQTNPAGLCKNTTGTGNFYQVSNRTSTGVDTDCHILSYSSNVTWELIDAANPAMGVVQHYGGGDVCAGQGSREIWVTLQCKRSGPAVFGKVSEDNPCDYSLTIQTPAACPQECPVVNGVLCAGHGVCGADGDMNVVRCFCNTGFGGNDCTESLAGSGGSSHATSILVAFVIILVVALLAMAVVLYRKIKRLNADDSRYGQLTDADDQSKRRAPPSAAAGGADSAAADHGAAAKLAAAVGDNV